MLLVLDSSILMNLKPGMLNFDELSSEVGSLRIVVTKAIFEELNNLAKGKGIKSKKARFALDVLSSAKIEVIDGELGEGDVSLLNIARRRDVIVATLDREVISGLKRQGKKVVTIRNERLAVV
ncbi:MAG: hypothetical protein QXV32_02520 [Conexivisphaerales archaeon]